MLPINSHPESARQTADARMSLVDSIAYTPCVRMPFGYANGMPAPADPDICCALPGPR
jgi:hypothetical protein